MAWFFYMLFDAWMTAKARRDGMPLPDPLGLNALVEGRDGDFRSRMEHVGSKIGNHVEYAAERFSQQWQQAGGAMPNQPASGAAPSATTAQPGEAASSAAAETASSGTAEPRPGFPPAPGAPGSHYQGVFGTAYSGPEGSYYKGPFGEAYSGPRGDYYHAPVGQVDGDPQKRQNVVVGAPAVHLDCQPSGAGAIVLIILGLCFLGANLGWLSLHWLFHFWPAILIALGVWLIVKRLHGRF